MLVFIITPIYALFPILAKTAQGEWPKRCVIARTTEAISPTILPGHSKRSLGLRYRRVRALLNSHNLIVWCLAMYCNLYICVYVVIVLHASSCLSAQRLDSIAVRGVFRGAEPARPPPLNAAIIAVFTRVLRSSKSTKINSGRGFAPDPTGGAYSAPLDP